MVRHLPEATMVWWMSIAALAGEHDVLLVGNSYTARNTLGEVLEQALKADGDWADASVHAITRGGTTLAAHAADAAAPTPSWATAGTTEWGVVVLQDQSQVPGLGADDPAFRASLAGVVALAEATGSARPVLLQTWGRRDGDRSRPERYPDFSTMQDRLTEGYAAYAAAVDGSVVAPVGEVFRVLHDADEALFGRLYEGDGSHPSPSGTYVIAATLHATLTGELPVGSTAAGAPVERARLDAAVRQVVLPAAVRPSCATSPSAAWWLGLVGVLLPVSRRQRLRR